MRSWLPTCRLGKITATAILTALLGSVIARANTLAEFETELQTIYKNNSNAIVRVKVATQKEEEEGKNSASLIVFSGFFISDDGKVLTNATPQKETTRVWIEKNGLSYLADVIGSDEKTNVSLLQVLNLPKDFSFISVDENVEKPPIGSFAIALTSPLDFAPSPSFGLITGYESNFAKFIFPFTYTRASIPIGPAEGGSPIFNSQGKLIGINMASMPEVRSSYSIPPKSLKRIVDDFISYGKVNYATLPFTMEAKAGRFNQEQIVTISKVEEDSSALNAGLKTGDTVVEINATKVRGINHARDTVFQQAPGAFLKLKIQRENTLLDFAIPLESDLNEL